MNAINNSVILPGMGIGQNPMARPYDKPWSFTGRLTKIEASTSVNKDGVENVYLTFVFSDGTTFREYVHRSEDWILEKNGKLNDWHIGTLYTLFKHMPVEWLKTTLVSVDGQLTYPSLRAYRTTEAYKAKSEAEKKAFNAMWSDAFYDAAHLAHALNGALELLPELTFSNDYYFSTVTQVNPDDPDEIITTEVRSKSMSFRITAVEAGDQK